MPDRACSVFITARLTITMEHSMARMAILANSPDVFQDLHSNTGPNI